eukprot:GCRY01001501.1.p1 GENE.GCRY01001501.1~~GCRY01001501.1.p1  ORF type:complete len:478 (-),score=106.01 GCRY01001501.1:1799-3232(-)
MDEIVTLRDSEMSQTLAFNNKHAAAFVLCDCLKTTCFVVPKLPESSNKGTLKPNSSTFKKSTMFGSTETKTLNNTCPPKQGEKAVLPPIKTEDIELEEIFCDWSQNASSLWKASGKPKMLTPVPLSLINSHLRQLNFSSRKINEIDKLFESFSSLEELVLSNNEIEVLENLPSSLKILHIYGNRLFDVSPTLGTFPHILHLGLGYNMLDNLAWLTPTAFPALMSLDIAFNDFSSLSELISTLSKIKTLRSLTILGNPLCLRRHYRGLLCRALPLLTHLDGHKLTAPETEEHELGSDLPHSDTEDDSQILEFYVDKILGILPHPEDDEKPAEEAQHRYTFSYEYQVGYSIPSALPILSTHDQARSKPAEKEPEANKSPKKQVKEKKTKEKEKDRRRPSPDTAGVAHEEDGTAIGGGDEKEKEKEEHQKQKKKKKKKKKKERTAHRSRFWSRPHMFDSAAKKRHNNTQKLHQKRIEKSA